MTRKILTACVLFIALASSPASAFAQVMTSGAYSIQADSINFAGGKSDSASYSLQDTAGEIATDKSASGNFGLNDAGYQSMTGSVAAPDATPPSAPTNVSATTISESSIEVTWDASTDNVGVTHYFIYRDGVKIDDVPTFPRNFVDTGLNPDTLYTYNVSALDATGNESAQSAPASARTNALPATVSNGGGGGAASGGQQIILTKYSVTPTETTALVSFDTSIPTGATVAWTSTDGTTGSVNTLGLTLAHSVILTGLKPSTEYSLVITITTANGTQIQFNDLSFRTLSTVNVVSVPNVSDFTATRDGDNADLTWILPQDPSIVGVRIMRSTSFYPTTPNEGDLIFQNSDASGVSATIDTDIKPGTLYYYSIFTKDISGNYSSGVVTHFQIALPGKPVATTTPIETLPMVSNVDPMIASLQMGDFLFIQSGDSLPVTNDTVTIDGNKNLTVALTYFRLPEILKTIAVTLVKVDANGNPKSFTFLLHVNGDKTRYQATIGPLGVTGAYTLKIAVVDFKNQGLKKLEGTLIAAGSASTKILAHGHSFLWWFWSLWLLILILLLAYLIKKWLEKRNKFSRAVAPVLVLALAGSLFVSIARAQTFNANPEVNYQGRLTDPSNVAVPDDNYNMRFKLYTTLTGGAPIWTETDQTSDKVAISNGLFSLMLGSTTPFTGVNFNQTLYLSVEIGGTSTVPTWDGEMNPRKILGTVPASFVADTLDGLDSTQFVRSDSTSTIATTSSQTVLTINQTGTGNLLDVQNAGVSQFKVGQNGFIYTTSTGTAATTTNLFSTTGTFTNLFATNFNLSGLLTAPNILATGSTTLQNFTFANGTGTSATTTNFFTTNLSATNFSLSGLFTAANLLVNGSSTFQNFTGLNNTTTNATSTSLFGTTGTFTNLFGTTANLTNLIFGNATGTNATTTNFFSTNASTTNLFYTTGNGGNETLTGTLTANNILAKASTTLQNFTFVNATGTSATTTNLFSTNASTTNLFSNNGTIGSLTAGALTVGPITSGLINGQTISSVANFTGTINATAGLTTLSNLLLTGSSTFQNLTFVNATGTSATTTNFFATNLNATTIKSTSNTTVGGSLLISSVLNCNASSQSLQTDGSGIVSCGTITGSGASVGGGWTSLAPNIVRLSTTTDVVGIGTTSPYAKLSINSGGQATTTLALVPVSSQTANVFDIYDTSGVLNTVYTAGGFLGIGSTTPTAKLSVGGDTFLNGNLYLTGNATTTNLFVTSSSTLQNFTFVNATGSQATTTNFFSTNLFGTNANFTNLIFVNATGTSATTTNFFSTNASSTNLFATNGSLGTLTAGPITSGLINGQTISSAANFTGTINATAGLTTLSNLLLTGSSTFQNLTFVNATGTSATTTNFFATTASSTNLFAQSSQLGGLVLNGILGSTQCLRVDSTGKVFGTGADCSSAGSSGTVTLGNKGQVPFYNDNGTTTVNATSSIFIAPSQFVGINNTNPLYQLDVIGNVNIASGNAYKINGINLATGNTANKNYFFGNAGNINAVGTDNVGVGDQALFTIGGGSAGASSQNVAVGSGALSNLGASGVSTGNVAVGYQTGLNISSAGSNDNIAVGRNALDDVVGSANVAIGAESMFFLNGAGGTTAVKNNVGVGFQTLNTGSHTLASSTALGYKAGFNDTGTDNLFLGAGADITSGTLNNAIAIGAQAKVAQSNSLALGGTGPYAVNVGIDTTSPDARLTVVGVSGQTNDLLRIASSTNINVFDIDSNGNVVASQNVTVSGALNNTTGVSTLSSLLFTNATGTNATTTNLFATTASTSKFFGANLTTCNAANQALTYNGTGAFGCTSITSAASSTLLTDNNGFTGNDTFTKLVVTNSTTTQATTTNLFSTTFNAVNASTTSLTTQNLLALSSSTLQNFTFTNATGSQATTTNFFATNLFGTTGNLTNLLLNGSTTLQNFTFVNATGTSATTTNFFATNASTTNLFYATAKGGAETLTGTLTANNLLANASSTLQNFTFVNGTGTSATTTNLFTTTASTSNFFGANLTTCNAANQALTYNGTGAFGCTSITSAASSTLLTDNNGFTGNDTFTKLTATLATTTSATTTNLAFTTLTNAVLSTNANGQVVATTSIGINYIGGLAAGVQNFLTTPSSANLATAVTDETGTAGALVFSNLPTLNQFISTASSTIGNGTLTGGLTVFGGATTTGNALFLGSTTLQNFTFVNATGTSATTTNLFSTNASTTNLFSNNGTIGSLTAGALTVGPITSGLINGQTISSVANFTGTINATAGLTTLANLIVNGSSTIGNNTTGGGLTINGGATTTGQSLHLGSTTLQNFTFVNGTGTQATTTNLFVTTTTGTTETLTGLQTAGNILALGSTTLQNFTFVNATGTSATTTNFFSTNASTTNLFANSGTIGNLTVGSCTGCGASSASSTLLTDNNGFTGNDTFTKLTVTTATTTNLLAIGSTTLQNFTFVNGTGTSATTTNFFSTNASTTNIFSIMASSTNLFATNGNIGTLTSNNVGVGTAAGTNQLLVKGGTALTPGTQSSYAVALGNSNSNDLTFGSDASFDYIQSWASKPLKINSVGNNILLAPDTLANVGIGVNTPGAHFHIGQTAIQSSPTVYTANSTDNQGLLINSYPNSNDLFRRYTDIASIGSEDGTNGGGIVRFLTNSATSLTAVEQMRIDRNGNVGLGSTTPYAKFSIQANAGDTNPLVLNISSTTAAFASTSLFSISNTGLVTATNLLVTGSTTLQNFTFVNATGTSATTTNFFSTNLFGTTGNFTNLLLNGSSTLQNFTFVNGTGTQATTSKFAITGITNGVLATNGNGSVIATTSIGVNYLTGVLPVANGGTGANSYNAGSVIFSDGTVLNQNNSNFFWDNSMTALGLGTTTPKWKLEIASSTAAQLALSDAAPADNQWTLRNAGGFLYFATASPSTFATSTTAALTVDNNGFLVNPALRSSSGSNCLQTDTNGKITNTGTACGSAGGANPAGSGTEIQARLNGTTFQAVSNSAFNSSFGTVGFGTTTPAWTLELASSTRPQLALSDGSLTSNHFTFRNAGGNLFIATASPSTFATSTTNLLTINGTTGNVGIGTATPGAPLHVVSSSNPQAIFQGTGAVSQIKIGGQTGGSIAAVAEIYRTTDDITAAAPANYERLTLGFNDFNGLGTDAYIGTERGGTGVNRALMFLMGSTEAMRLATNGNVGIKTTTPITQLDVASSTAPQIALTNPGAGTNSKHLVLDWTGSLLNIGTSSDSDITSTSTALSINTVGSPGLSIGSTSPWGMVSINPNGITGPQFVIGSSTGTNLVVSNGGLVGIGTTTPNANLTVNGSVFFNATTTFTNNGLGIYPFNLGGVAGNGAWIDMPSTGPSGIGSGGVGQNAWIALAFANNQYFNDSKAGDIIYRDALGQTLRFGIDNGAGNAASIMQIRNAAGVAGVAINNGNTVNSGALYVNTNAIGGGNSDGIFINSVDGTTNAIVGLENQGVRQFSLGIDVGDNNKFKIKSGSSFSAGNTLLTVTPAYIGIGTSSPQWLLELASSTSQQLALSDGTLTDNHWTLRNAGGFLYFATASPSTFGTSTTAALTIDSNGFLVDAAARAASGNNCLQVDTAGKITNTGSACGSGGGSGNNMFATSTNGVAIYPNGGTNIALVVGGTATTSNNLLEVNGFISTDKYSGYRQDNLLLAYASSTNFDTIFGFKAGGQNATTSSAAGSLTAVGYQALNANTTGTQNTALGFNGLTLNTTGSSNVGLGYSALSKNTTGNNNTGSGFQSLFNVTTGTGNTALGANTGFNITTGYDNVFIGEDQNMGGTGSITTGGGNIGLGYNIKFPSASTNLTLNIGNSLFGLLPATTTATTLGLAVGNSFGISTSTPWGKFSIQANNGDTFKNLFIIASSTSLATTTLFSVDNAGNVFVNGSTTLQNFTFVNGTGTQATTTNFFSTNLFGTTGNLTNLLLNGSSTLQNFTFLNGTGTSATTTNLFVTTTTGTAETLTGLQTAGNFLALGSSTLQNFTFVNGTGTSATTTNFFSTNASTTNFFTNNGTIGTLTVGSALHLGSTTLQNFTALNATTSNATSTNFFATTASSTNLFTSAFSAGSNGLTVTSAGNIGVGSSTPWGKFSLELDGSNPAFVLSNQGSSTPTLYVGGANQNGFIGLGTTTNNSSLARLILDNTINSTLGSTQAIAGIHENFAFNPSAANTVQVGNREVVVNAPSPNTATNTAVGTLIRMVDNSGISNLVRGLEVVASAGTDTFGVNTGIRGTGHTFGVQGITTGLAGGTSTPAALYGENDGTTQGDILRLYTNTMTSAASEATFYQEASAFTGNGLTMNFANGGGTFTGNFLNLQAGGNTKFKVDYNGTTTIGQTNQQTTPAGLLIPFGSICVDNDGTCTGTTTGDVAAVAYLTGHTADVAENYYSTDSLEPGEIVSTKGYTEVGRASTNDDTVIGVVSTHPGLDLSTALFMPGGASQYPIGLVGRVPVKLSTENGPIAVGDKITLSSIPGVGMKYDPTKGGTIVGIALEAYDGSVAMTTGSIEVNTQKEAAGTPVCTTTTSQSDGKAYGGDDAESGTHNSHPQGTTISQTNCAQDEVTIIPDAGTPQTQTVGTKSVNIGSALVFLDIEHASLTAANGVMPAAQGDFDLNSHKLLNVDSIASANGKWSINSDGDLVVQTIDAQKGTFEQNLEVGTQAKPTGITIYDSATGEPYCMKMTNGVMASVQGACLAAVPTSPQDSSTITTTGTTTTYGGGDTSTTTPPTTPPDSGTSTTTPPVTPPTTPPDSGTGTTTPPTGSGIGSNSTSTPPIVDNSNSSTTPPTTG